MNKIQYRAQYPTHYESKTGTLLIFNDVEYAYSKNEDELLDLTHINTGIKVSKPYKTQDEILEYFKKNEDVLTNFNADETSKKLSERLDKLVTLDEYREMKLIFEDKIGISSETFYNDAILISCESVKFDLNKFNSYLEFEYHPRYSDDMSCKEFILSEFGEKFTNAVEYFMQL